MILAPATVVGQVPKELPDWFKLLDEDQDGQVTLFEWRRAGKSIDEFKEWDRNDDGLITPAELFARLRSNPDLAPVDDGFSDVRMGKMMFTREWSVQDPRTAKGDGLGPVFNATSCAQCHSKGGLGGSGDLKHNVTTFVREGENGKLVQGVIHAHATSPEFQENLSHAHPSLAPIVEPTLKQIMRLQISRATFQVNQLNPPALFGANLIDDLPD
jgi:mono/diheme cytochrome c family protein